MKAFKEYRRAARTALSGHWSPAIVATIVMILIALVSSGSSIAQNILQISGGDPHSRWLALVGGVSILSVLWVYNVTVGYANAFLHFYDTGDDQFTSNTFKLGFGNYGPILGAYLLVTLIILGLVLVPVMIVTILVLTMDFPTWASFVVGFLSMIPAIVISLNYVMVPYLIVDETGIGIVESLKTSRKMMYGHKWEYFLLCMSFIGWILLSVLTLFIGYLWLMPYMYTTLAIYYRDLKLERSDIFPSMAGGTVVASGQGQ